MSTISKKIGVTDAEQSKNILNDRKVMTVPDFRARKGTE